MTAGNGNVAAEKLLEAAEMVIVPSWGTGRQGWGTETMMAVITRSETATEIEPRAGSELRLSLLKICEKKARNYHRERTVM